MWGFLRKLQTKTPCNTVHTEAFLLREREPKKREVPGTGTAEERQREMGGRQGHFKRERSKYAQEVLFVAADEDISCQDPKGRPARCLNTNRSYNLTRGCRFLEMGREDELTLLSDPLSHEQAASHSHCHHR